MSVGGRELTVPPPPPPPPHLRTRAASSFPLLPTSSAGCGTITRSTARLGGTCASSSPELPHLNAALTRLAPKSRVPHRDVWRDLPYVVADLFKGAPSFSAMGPRGALVLTRRSTHREREQSERVFGARLSACLGVARANILEGPSLPRDRVSAWLWQAQAGHAERLGV